VPQTRQKPDREGGLVAQVALAYAGVSDAAKSFVSNYNAFNCRLQVVHLAARESRVTKHLINFRKGISIATWRAAQHLHRESSRLGRRNAIVVRHKFQSHRATAIC